MKTLRLCLPLAAPALLGSCVSLYMPTLPAPPLVSKGQVEVVASLRSITTVGVAAAWAPTRHLLLLGELTATESDSSIRTSQINTKYHDYHRQGSLGVGYYHASTATSPLYWAAVGGIGYASTRLHAVDIDIVSIASVYYDGLYRASYRRYYGQMYVAEPRSTGLTVGGLLRGNLLDYTRLMREDTTASPTSRVFAEPMLFLRAGQGALRVQVSAGFSVPLGGSATPSASSLTSPISSLIGFGLVFRPDLLKRRR